MYNLLENLLIGIVSGLVSGYLISKYFREKDESERKEIEKYKQRDVFDKYYQKLYVYIELLKISKVKNDDLLKLLSEWRNVINQTNIDMFDTLQEKFGMKIIETLMLTEHMVKTGQVDLEKLQQILLDISMIRLHTEIQEGECYYCKNLKKCKKIGRCINQN